MSTTLRLPSAGRHVGWPPHARQTRVAVRRARRLPLVTASVQELGSNRQCVVDRDAIRGPGWVAIRTRTARNTSSSRCAEAPLLLRVGGELTHSSTQEELRCMMIQSPRSGSPSSATTPIYAAPSSGVPFARPELVRPADPAARGLRASPAVRPQRSPSMSNPSSSCDMLADRSRRPLRSTGTDQSGLAGPDGVRGPRRSAGGDG